MSQINIGVKVLVIFTKVERIVVGKIGIWYILNKPDIRGTRNWYRYDQLKLIK